MNEIKIKTALISVFNKTGLDPIIKTLHEQGVTIFSTGGTQKYIEDLGVPVKAVEDLTGYPSILGGRVKTLHPKVFGGILNRQGNPSDEKEIISYEIPQIDLVIVDLYPFEDTVAASASEDEIIEKIDIGGIALIRAAAKNFKDVLCISNKKYYAALLELLKSKKGLLSLADRKRFAARAFADSSHYDSAIFNYFSADQDTLKISSHQSKKLRYGENPHQVGHFFGPLEDLLEQIHGKEISYNNLLDIDAAVQLMEEFYEDAPTFAILKHNNACGLATREKLSEAYTAALAGDPISAFGGVLIANRTIDLETAEAMHSLFFEVIIAPHFEAEAQSLLTQKKNRVLLIQKSRLLSTNSIRTCLNGYLVQDKDSHTDSESDLKNVTIKTPDSNEIADLLFASKICKHTKSNTIVLAKNKQLLAAGTGQTSRVDALEQAIKKAQKFEFDLSGAVMASDAFFPFPDCVTIAHQAGIAAVIQPGGSIKDQDSIDYCNQNGVKMVLTGVRHFKH